MPNTLTIGSYAVSAHLDDDGHLTVAVRSLDGSPVIGVDEDVTCSDAEFAVRLTTVTIEASV